MNFESEKVTKCFVKLYFITANVSDITHQTHDGPSHLPSVSLGGLQAAVSQAAVGCGATAADDLQLFLGAVGSVQQLLNKLLQADFSVGLPRRGVLQELVDLCHLPEDGAEKKRRKKEQMNLMFAAGPV